MTGEFGPPKFLVYFASLYASPRFPVAGLLPGGEPTGGAGLCEDTELGVAVGETKIVVVCVTSTVTVETMVGRVEFALMGTWASE